MTDEMSDALADALGGIISDLRKEWRKDVEIISAESRATIAELKAANTELLAAFREGIAGEVKRVDSALANVRDGKDVDQVAVERTITEHVYAAVEALEKGIRVPEDGKSVTLEDVQPLIDKAVAGIRVPEDGKSVTLDDLQPVIAQAVEQLQNEIRAAFTQASETFAADIATKAVATFDAAVAALPVPQDGKSVTLEDVQPLIDKAVAGIRVPEDGKSVDKAEVERTLADAVEQMRKDVGAGLDTELQTFAAKIDEAVKGIRVPEDGKSVTLEDVQPLIDQAVAGIRVPEDGKSVTLEDVRPILDEAIKNLRVPEDGKSVDMAEVEALVTRTLDAWEHPKDGKSVTLDEVKPLIDEAVKAIPVPRDGAGLADAVIDRDQNLVLTMTDGRTKNMGRVVGRDVDQREILDTLRVEFTKAFAEIPKPQDGEDGLGFDDMSVDHDGERTIILRWARGGVVKEASIKMPVVIDRGVYKAESQYERGDGVTYGGSYWIAQDDTAEKPGEGKTAWRLSMKRPRDGKDVVRSETAKKPFRFQPEGE